MKASRLLNETATNGETTVSKKGMMPEKNFQECGKIQQTIPLLIPYNFYT